MKPETIKSVQDTFAMVEPIADKAAELFYGKLFEMDPSVRPMFKTDLSDQGAKLMRMIGIAVRGLTDLDSIVPAVKNLGIRHIDYGVKDEHYNTVGAALLWTLEQGLGDAFTDEVKEAWTEVYTLLATVMKEAAHEAA